MDGLVFLVVVGGFGLIAILGAGFMVSRFYRKVEQGQVLIINKVTKEPLVTFTGGLVLPIIHRAETMDISVKTIETDRRGKEGLICRDNIRADIKVTFFVKVNKTTEDVLKVAQQVGCARASDPNTLEELFQAKFSEALKTVGKQLDFEELYTKREGFKDEIIRTIGRDLNGYVLDDAAIDYLEQTPLDSLDPANILDAQGIRKITELTAAQNVQTNELRQAERKAIRKQNVEAEEAVLALSRQEEEARARQEREITVLRAREAAESQKVQAEEHKKAEMARLKADEELQVADAAKRRQVEVAEKNRERVVVVETERVEKDRALEQIVREREVEISRIAKEKEIEIQKKEIADVVRSRIVVDKTVAEEEERIKDTRALAQARREKDVAITAAEAQAQEMVVKQVKTAEARQEVAKLQAKEKVILADADLEAADRHTKAKIRLAEGVQAETAAEGLARVRVKEAEVIAQEKEGITQAKITKEKLLASAQGREAEAIAVEKVGLAEAKVEREKLLAEAKGAEEKGLAQVRIEEAEANAIQKRGLAEAATIEKKLVAEAIGIAQKAEAMKSLDASSREHEEFRLRLEQQRVVQLAHIEAEKEMAKARAEILREALGAAKIQIVGGDGAFFDRFVNAVAIGKSVDGFVDNSSHVQQVFGKYLSGEANLPGEIVQALGHVSPQDLASLGVAGVLGKLMLGADPATQKKLRSLMERAEQLGLTAKGEPSN